MITINDEKIEPTIFPDGTSQVWKLSPQLDYIKNSDVRITWLFKNESELFHILQLCELLHKVYDARSINLVMPYLPYARQDKEVDSDQTFALHTFLNVISQWVTNITVFDPHSDVYKEYFPNAVVISPDVHILAAMKKCNCDMICYTDKNTSTRYPAYNNEPQVIMGKTRDKQTGEITGLEITAISDDPGDLKGLKVLIVNDLCDDGSTFIEASKLLYKNGASEVNLYVSHGIFSKGIDILHKHGIIRVFTKDGLVSEKKDERAISLQKK